jgi:hypothetical protein
MKYLKDELYSRSKEDEWRKAYARFEKEFFRIKHKFPKDFVVEMLEKHAFHDSYIRRLALDMAKPEEELLCVEMSDGFDSRITHTITLRGVSALKMSGVLWQDWLYAEILPQKKGRLSLEAAFSDNGMLYVEFKILEYSCDPATCRGGLESRPQ